MSFRLRFVIVLACMWMIACGGKTGQEGASGSAGTTTGAGGATGTGTASSTSTGGSATGGSAGSGGQAGATCAFVCERILQAGCPDDACEAGCEKARTISDRCVSQFDAVLSCAATAPIVCGPMGEVDFPDCEMLVSIYRACVDSRPPPLDAGISPECSSIPPPPEPTVCSGGGTTGTTSGGGGVPSCSTECRDNAGHAWSSNCYGTTCTCSYNGIPYCQCVVAGDSCLVGSCCPGLR
ncbi:MAG TPA: hypothetical protein VF881_09840 [Polyangiaceae bacterium]